MDIYIFLKGWIGKSAFISVSLQAASGFSCILFTLGLRAFPLLW